MNNSQTRAVFISGCDSGFGLSLVKKLSALKKFLVFAGVFTESGKSLFAEYENVVAIPLDVTSDESVARALELIQAKLAERNAVLWGLVNNAGILTRPAPTEWQGVENYDKMMQVNLFGVVRLTNACLPQIRRSKGRIVIVASIAGRVGLASNAAYCASKYAVSGYAEVLRRDLIPWGVAVSVVEPGIFGQTGLYGDFQKGLDATWKTLPENLKQDYGEKHYKFQRMMLGSAVTHFSNSSPEQVPEAMLEALTASKPQRRYRVGKDSKTIFRLLPILPDHVTDAILTRPVGKKVVNPAGVHQAVAGNEIYAADTTSSLVLTGLAGLSALGTFQLGKFFISRL